jgi:hypothetical protein
MEKEVNRVVCRVRKKTPKKRGRAIRLIFSFEFPESSLPSWPFPLEGGVKTP